MLTNLLFLSFILVFTLCFKGTVFIQITVSYFFGKDSSTEWCRLELEETIPNYRHHSLDIRDFDDLKGVPDVFINGASDRIKGASSAEAAIDRIDAAIEELTKVSHKLADGHTSKS